MLQNLSDVRCATESCTVPSYKLGNLLKRAGTGTGIEDAEPRGKQKAPQQPRISFTQIPSPDTLREFPLSLSGHWLTSLQSHFHRQNLEQSRDYSDHTSVHFAHTPAYTAVTTEWTHQHQRTLSLQLSLYKALD